MQDREPSGCLHGGEFSFPGGFRCGGGVVVLDVLKKFSFLGLEPGLLGPGMNDRGWPRFVLKGGLSCQAEGPGAGLPWKLALLAGGNNKGPAVGAGWNFKSYWELITLI